MWKTVSANYFTLSLKIIGKTFGQVQKSPYLCTRKWETTPNMVDVVQLVRASDCGSECRGFEPHPPPQATVLEDKKVFKDCLFSFIYPLLA